MFKATKKSFYFLSNVSTSNNSLKIETLLVSG